MCDEQGNYSLSASLSRGCYANHGLILRNANGLPCSQTGPGARNDVENEDVDLVFIGVEKRSKVGKLLFGSTAQHVILNSPCPVVTVNSPEHS